jgi:hypothetical protein
MSPAWASSGCGIANTMAAPNALVVAIEEKGQAHDLFFVLVFINLNPELINLDLWR